MVPLLFRSIRARLVISYVCLTLLTVGLMSALALKLAESIASQREARYLSANARVIASRVAPLFVHSALPVDEQRESLAEAAEVASIMGNLRVRILNQQR